MHITLKERKLLELFCDRADAVFSSPIFSGEKTDFGLNISWERGGPLKMTHQGPSNLELVPIVTIVRQLYSQKETIYFHRVYNPVYRLLESSGDTAHEALSYAKTAMAEFKSAINETRFDIRVGKKKLKPSDIVDIWFNGSIFHADLRKAEIYRRLWRSPVGSFADHCFRVVVMRLSVLMVNFSRLIRIAVFSESGEESDSLGE